MPRTLALAPRPEVAAAHYQPDLDARAVRLCDFFSDAGDDFRRDIVMLPGLRRASPLSFRSILLKTVLVCQT